MSIYHESLTPPDLKELLQRKQFLEKTQSKLEARLAKAPDGRLATSRQSRYSYASFYHVSKDGNRVYLDQSQKETIAALAQKEYDRKALKVVKEELMRLKMVLSYVKMQKLEDVYDRCLSEKRSFITPIVLSDEEFRQRWLSQAYVKKQPLENDHPFPTEKGDIVLEGVQPGDTQTLRSSILSHGKKSYSNTLEWSTTKATSIACSTRSDSMKRMDTS